MFIFYYFKYRNDNNSVVKNKIMTCFRQNQKRSLTPKLKNVHVSTKVPGGSSSAIINLLYYLGRQKYFKILRELRRKMNGKMIKKKMTIIILIAIAYDTL